MNDPHLRRIGYVSIAASLAAAVLLAGVAGAAHAAPTSTGVDQEACKAPGASVTRAYRTSRGAPAPAPNEPGTTDVQLGDEIILEVTNLTKLVGCETPNNPVVLYLGGNPLRGLVRNPKTDPQTGKLQFSLAINDAARGVWAHLLGSPGLKPLPVPVSVGLQNEYAMPSDAALQLHILPPFWVVTWLVIFLGLGIAFFCWARNTNIIRDGQPDPEAKDWRGPFSLSRTQAAWWFFVVLASYLLIGLVTGDFSGSLNATALTLLGIGAATAVGSAAISASKASPQAEREQKTARETATSDASQFTTQAAILRQQANDASDPAAKARLLQQADEVETRLRVAESSRTKLLNQSENFFQDLVSDANGVAAPHPIQAPPSVGGHHVRR